MSKSLGFRFNVFAVSVITLLLSLFGVYDYVTTSNSVNQKMDSDIAVLVESLQGTLPSLIWNYQNEQMKNALAAAIKNSNVTGLLVYEGDKPTVGFIRNKTDEYIENTDSNALGEAAITKTLQYHDDDKINDVGRLVVVKNIAFVEDQKRQAVYNSIVRILVLGFLVSVSINILLANLVKSPLNKITDALRDIASGDGDLTQRLHIERSDEVGEVALYFNNFVDKIHLSMQQVESSTGEINNTVDTVNANAKENLLAVERAKEETDMVATAITQMSASAHDVANNARETSQSAINADTETKNTQRVIQETSDSISALAEEVQEGATVMSSLKGDVNSIVGVLDTIRGIAEQTNLLALNAAIEAARAGDQGRGFAVVADEVRALAARTQESTRQIQATIAKLESGSDQAVDVMKRSTERSIETVDKVGKAMLSLDRIAEAISNINDMSSQIATAVEQQTHVTEEISNNVTTIANVIEDTAVGARQTSEASASLAGNARTLRAMVGQFRL